MENVILPSGAELIIDLPIMELSEAVLEAVSEELFKIEVKGTDDIDWNMLKNLFCLSLASKKIKDATKKCMGKCLYRGLRIDSRTWDADDNRQDYIPALFEVAKANIIPLVKGLTSGSSSIIKTVMSDLSLRQTESKK